MPDLNGIEFYWILSIFNKKSKFKVGVFNDIYEINIRIFFKILNNIKLCTSLNVLILIIIIK
jgi:hypothetical protein